MEWKSRNEITEEEVKSPTPKAEDVKWIPPDPMSLKCNTDGAWSKETGTGGLAGYYEIIKDCWCGLGQRNWQR